MHKIKLTATHTHAGEVYFAGDVIDVDETTARWLIEHGVGQPENGGANTSADDSEKPSTKSQPKAKE